MTPVREMIRGVSRAYATVVEGGDALAVEHDADRGRDVERGPARARSRADGGPELCDEMSKVVGAELIALGPNARSEKRAHVAAADVTQRRDRRLDDTGRETSVAGVHHGDGVVAGDDEWRAIGGNNDEREIALGGDESVGLG